MKKNTYTVLIDGVEKEKTPDELIAHWTSLLRSRKYTQTHGMLQSSCGQFCCLGVLCDSVSLQGSWLSAEEFIEYSSAEAYDEYEGYPSYVTEEGMFFVDREGNIAEYEDSGSIGLPDSLVEFLGIGMAGEHDIGDIHKQVYDKHSKKHPYMLPEDDARGFTCLTHLNDKKHWPFEAIADLIDARPEGLFSA